MLTKLGSYELDTKFGAFRFSGYLFGDNQQVVIALWRNSDHSTPYLRLQYGCIAGTAFGAIDCDCGLQTEAALTCISKADSGVFIYFADHEAFGLGLAAKIRISQIERDTGRSFFDIAKDEGVPPRSSDVLWTVPHIFNDIGFDRSVVLLGTSGLKERRLKELGFQIVRIEELNIEESMLTKHAVVERETKRSL